MNSKEALSDLFFLAIGDEKHTKKCKETIEKDLEVLEILKGMLTVEKGSTWYYLDTKHPFFEKQEDIDKVKEWLESDFI